MSIRALALLAALSPATVVAQETLVLAAAVAEPPMQPALQPVTLPVILPGGAVRVADAPPATPGLWLNF